MRTETKQLPASEVEINFKGNKYKLSFPNSGQFADIELLKSSLSSNNYSGLFGSTLNAEWARYLIDTVATFNILIPDLNKDLNSKGVLELPLQESMLLVKEYKKTYLPWYNEWMTIITSDDV
jgi:hypothetical protein